MRVLPSRNPRPRAHTGRHRFLLTRTALRRECGRLNAEADELTCKLIKACAETDQALRQRDDLTRAFEAAGMRIAALAEQVRDRGRLEGEVTALRAELANAQRMRQLGASDTPSAEELAAAGRAVADTVELAQLDEPMVNTTRESWRPAAAASAGTTAVHGDRPAETVPVHGPAGPDSALTTVADTPRPVAGPVVATALTAGLPGTFVVHDRTVRVTPWPGGRALTTPRAAAAQPHPQQRRAR